MSRSAAPSPSPRYNARVSAGLLLGRIAEPPAGRAARRALRGVWGLAPTRFALAQEPLCCAITFPTLQCVRLGGAASRAHCQAARRAGRPQGSSWV